MTKEQEINLLQRQIAVTERSPDYTFRWDGVLLTLYRAELLKEKLAKKLTPQQMKGTLQPIREQAIEKSKKFPTKKVFVNVDDKGNCFIDSKFNKDATVFCYRNGSQVMADSNNKQKETVNNLNSNVMATKTKAAKKETVKKSNLVTVNGLTYNGKPVQVPAGKAKKWASFLKKPNAKGDGKVAIKGLSFNKKPVFLPKGRAAKWQAVLDK